MSEADKIVCSRHGETLATPITEDRTRRVFGAAIVPDPNPKQSG